MRWSNTFLPLLKVVLLLIQLDGVLPVFLVETHHEVFEVVHGICIGCEIPFIHLTIKLKVFFNEFVHCLLLLLDFVHFGGNFVQFFVVFIEGLLHSDQQIWAQIA